MADLKKLAEELVNLTVKDVNELAQILKDEYGKPYFENLEIFYKFINGLNKSKLSPPQLPVFPLSCLLTINLLLTIQMHQHN